MQRLKEHLSGKKHIIWDWNGTLLNDVDMVVAVMNEVLLENALPKITRAQYADMFGFPVSNYYLGLGFDFEKTPFEKVSEKFVAGYMRDILGCDLHSGVPELLSELKDSGYSQSILSAAHEESLFKHLAHFQIDHFFDRIYALGDHHARGKIERGRELLADSGFSADDSVLIGDTDHDLEVGKALGVHVVLLGDGHQSFDRLSALHSPVLRER